MQVISRKDIFLALANSVVGAILVAHLDRVGRHWLSIDDRWYNSPVLPLGVAILLCGPVALVVRASLAKAAFCGLVLTGLPYGSALIGDLRHGTPSAASVACSILLLSSGAVLNTACALALRFSRLEKPVPDK